MLSYMVTEGRFPPKHARVDVGPSDGEGAWGEILLALPRAVVRRRRLDAGHVRLHMGHSWGGR